jgi:hypothetical protein
MWQRHNAQLTNFDVTSLRVTSTATRQQHVQVMRDEATRKPMIAAHEEFLENPKKPEQSEQPNLDKTEKAIASPKLPNKQPRRTSNSPWSCRV